MELFKDKRGSILILSDSWYLSSAIRPRVLETQDVTTDA